MSFHTVVSQDHNLKNDCHSCSPWPYVLNNESRNASQSDHDSHIINQRFSGAHSDAVRESTVLDLRKLKVEEAVVQIRTSLDHAHRSIFYTRSYDSEVASRSRVITLVTGMGAKVCGTIQENFLFFYSFFTGSLFSPDLSHLFSFRVLLCKILQRQLLQRILQQEGILFMDNGGDSFLVYVSNFYVPSSSQYVTQPSPSHLHKVTLPQHALFLTNALNAEAFRYTGDVTWMSKFENRRNIHSVLLQQPCAHHLARDIAMTERNDIDKLAIDVRFMTSEDSIAEVRKFITRIRYNALASGIDLGGPGVGMFATIITGIGTKVCQLVNSFASNYSIFILRSQYLSHSIVCYQSAPFYNQSCQETE